MKETRNLPIEERVKLYQKAIQLHKEFGLGNKRIANILGINPATVGDWLYRKRSPLTIFNKMKEKEKCLNSRRRMNELTIEERIELYQKALTFHKKFGWGHRKIAKKLKIYPKVVYGWLYDGRSPLNKLNVFEKKPNPLLAYIIGVVLGDGSIGIKKGKVGIRSGRIRLCVKDKEFATNFSECISKLLGKKKNYSIHQTKDGRWEVTAFSTLLANFLKQDFNALKQFINSYPAEFIKGFADSEGWPVVSATKNEFDIEIQMSNTNRDILLYIKELLKKYFGIESIVRLSERAGEVHFKNKTPIITKQDCYLLRICNFNNVKKFAKLIGFSIKSKQEKLLGATSLKEKFPLQECVNKWKLLYKKVKRRWEKILY